MNLVEKNEHLYFEKIHKIDAKLNKDCLEDSKIKLMILKENPEYNKFFTNFLEWDKKSRGKKGRVWPRGSFNFFGLAGIRFFLPHHIFYKYDEIIDLINPKKDISTVSEKLIAAVLPRLFYDHSVELIEFDELKTSKRHIFHEANWIRTMYSGDQLEPWERIYKIDLRKGKTHILKEFDGILKKTYLKNENWNPYNKEIKRNRSEVLKQLKVWKEYKKTENFPEIAEKLKIPLSTVRDQYCRAHLLITGKVYDLTSKYTNDEKELEANMLCEKCPHNFKCYIEIYDKKSKKKTMTQDYCNDYKKIVGKTPSVKTIGFNENIDYDDK
ncbi:MAG: hypothetical protein PHX78_02780 [bacterium]|nr:hypothetical protein [bacterium]